MFREKNFLRLLAVRLAVERKLRLQQPNKSLPPMSLAQQIIQHPRNTRIEFLVDEHEYYFTTDEGDRVQFQGVTGWIENFSPYFDRDKIAAGVARRDGKSTQQVLAEWKATNVESINRGNYVHDALEEFVLTGEIRNEALVDGFIASYEAMGFQPVTAEWTIYDERIGRASSIDGNFIDATGRYVIVDYKTNKDGVKQDSYKNQTLLHPLHHLRNSKYAKYSLQVSLYRHWVEQFYLDPADVADLHWILHIDWKDEQWIFSWMPALDLRDEITLMYQDKTAAA